MTVWAGPKSEAYEPEIIDRPLLGDFEVEPWRDLIGYDRETEVVETPLPSSNPKYLSGEGNG